MFQVGAGFFGAAHIRLGDNLDQRYAGTVVVYCRRVGGTDRSAAVVQLPGIFFHMDTGHADTFFPAFHFNVDMAAQANRLIELRDLIVFDRSG